MSVESKQRTLTDDGFSEEFFHLLQTKDTVVFKYGQPSHWFFTTSNGKIRKKNKNNLLNARIEECFNKYILGYDVVATFISMPDADHETGQFPASTVEYLDRKGLNELLYVRPKKYSGILQRFIEPSGIRNETIRAIWSPKICILERAENIHEIHDDRYGLYERCVTFEGPEYYYKTTPLRGPVLAGQIQKICEGIAAHISSVTFGQRVANRMVLNFKVDSRDTIFLQQSTSIRIIDMNEAIDPKLKAMGKIKRELVNIDNVLALPDSVNLNPVRSHSKVIAKKRIYCLSCSKESLEDLRYPVTYKSIIKHYEHVLYLCTVVNGKDRKMNGAISWPPQEDIIQSAGGVGFGCLRMGMDGDEMKTTKIDMNNPLEAAELKIPPILRTLHSKITISQYLESAKDPLFLYKTCQVCESCYLVYAEFTTMLLRLGQDLRKLLEPDPKGVEAIRKAKNATLHDESFNGSSSLNRPSSADWKAMSSVNRSSSAASDSINKPGHLRASTNHKHARENAIGLRSDDTNMPPGQPARVARAGDLQRAATAQGFHGSYNENSLQQGSVASWMSGNDNGGTGMGSTILGSPSIVNYGQSMMSNSFMDNTFNHGGGGGGGYHNHNNNNQNNNENVDNFNKMSYQESVQSMIKEREMHFFKEVSRNPQLKDQHPLMHLIASQNKLALADESSGIVASKTAMKQEHVFGARYGKQSQDKHDKFGIYNEELPYIVRGKIVLPSVLKKQKEDFKKSQSKMIEERKQKRLARRKLDSEANELNSIADASLASASDDLANGSAANHRTFLKDALVNIENEMKEAQSRK